MHQKARLWWLKEGNSGDPWVEGVTNVREVMKNYFQSQFTETPRPRPTLDGIVFQKVSSSDNTDLIALDAVWSCDGDNSPGPDGDNFFWLFFCLCVVYR